MPHPRALRGPSPRRARQVHRCGRAPGTVSISGGPGSLPRALPQVGPPGLPACTARPPPWAREPGQFKDRDGARLGGCACDSDAPGQVAASGRRISQRWATLQSLSASHKLSRGLAEQARRGLVSPCPAWRVLAAIGWGGGGPGAGGAGRDPPPRQCWAVKWVHLVGTERSAGNHPQRDRLALAGRKRVVF